MTKKSQVTSTTPNIVNVYVALITKGLKQIGEVPETIREEVKKMLK